VQKDRQPRTRQRQGEDQAQSAGHPHSRAAVHRPSSHQIDAQANRPSAQIRIMRISARRDWNMPERLMPQGNSKVFYVVNPRKGA